MKACSSGESIISIFPTHYIDITIRDSGCFQGEPSDVFATRGLRSFLETEDPTHSNNIAYLLNIFSQRGTHVCVP
jgi:hypothetical protein